MIFAILLISCGSDWYPTPVKQPIPENTRPDDQPPPIPDVLTIIDIPIHDPLADFSDEYKNDCLKKIFLR